MSPDKLSTQSSPDKALTPMIQHKPTNPKVTAKKIISDHLNNLNLDDPAKVKATFKCSQNEAYLIIGHFSELKDSLMKRLSPKVKPEVVTPAL